MAEPTADATPSPDGHPHPDHLVWPVRSAVGPGLHGAIAGETGVAARDPQTGAVRYRGVPVEHLTARHTFEEVAWLLLDGRLPRPDDADWQTFTASLRAARELPDDVADLVCAPLDIAPLRLLRAGLSALGSRAVDETHDVTPRQAGTIVGQCAGLIMQMAHHRRRLRAEAAGPATGEPPGPASIRADAGLDTGLILAVGAGSGERIQQVMQMLGTCLTLVADDGLEPATFAGLVVASCDADPYSAVVATLSGLTGAFGRPVDTASLPDARLDMLRRLAGDTDAIHATPLDEQLERLAADGLIHADAAARPGLLPLAAGWLLLNGGGGLDDPPLLPALLALPRLVAMLARMREYMRSLRLFRPFARYVGPAPRPVPPLADRDPAS